MAHTMTDRYNTFAAEAKKLRSAARRAEARGDMAKAMELRDQVDGINSELQHMRQNWMR